MRSVALEDAHRLPVWRQPFALLVLMAAAMPLAFGTWMALQVNFVVEIAGFDGKDNGLLHSIREIPGFLAIGVIAILLVMREQTLALLSLVVLGVGTAVVAEFPLFWGIMATTFISSIGFHFFETVNQSLQLQWLPKARAPQMMGWLLATGSASSLLVYGVIALGWEPLGLTYQFAYWLGGGACLALALAAWLVFPHVEGTIPQTKTMVLRRRYWLYYALVFISGARRQIFLVFAAFMMVEKFGFAVHQLTALFLINYVVNIGAAPIIGRMIGRFGERAALQFEYAGLIAIFLAYGAIYFADWGAWAWATVLAGGLYVLDHVFFALALAIRTYFQKIADPADFAPTAAVSFTINHIAAVGLPAPLGLLWLISPGAVFGLAAGLAAVSLILASLIPRDPVPGRETTLGGALPQAAE